MHKLWIDRNEPARNWQQAFLMGNGFMGQALYGLPDSEIIDLSESTFFSGEPGMNYQKDAHQAFSRMREAAVREDYNEMEHYTEAFIGIRGNYGTNLPVGQIKFSWMDQAVWEDYRRILDMERGMVQVCFRRNGSSMFREAFSSHRDRIFVYRLQDGSAEGMHGHVSFKNGERLFRTGVYRDAYTFETQALESVHSDGSCGVKLRGMIYPAAADGEIIVTKDQITLKGVHEVVFYLVMETDYQLEAVSENAMNVLPEMPEIYGKVWHSIQEYDSIKERHIAEIKNLIGRQKLYLKDSGGAADDLSVLMYQYGRYLLLCSSREDSILPAHLQGVWNDNVACRIGWTCDMHLDINTQMNYWISEAGNLPECHKPLFRWMEERVIPEGRKNAMYSYGKPGWAAELTSNAWGYAAPYWNKSLSPCPTGGIWQASDYMEHYRYTQDREFLRGHALPVLREAVIFFLEYLYEDVDGSLCTGPSISPENAFLVKGKKYFASASCTYEVTMIRELFGQFLELCRILDCESILAQKVKEARTKLPAWRILPDGTVAEWSHDHEAFDVQHRHTSHLLGLFPYSQITKEETPHLALAAERTIQSKLNPPKNWEDTGWARSMLALYCARLYDGNGAYNHLYSMQNNLTGPNLLVMHPPTRGADSFMEVYELDGNTGFSMAVSEMLIQSHNGVVRLLPALPDEWSDGWFEGAMARGGICVDMEWKDKTLTKVEAESSTNTECVFRFRDQEIHRFMKAGEKIPLVFYR